MLLIPTRIEVPGHELPSRATPVVWAWLALVLAVFACERLVVVDRELGLGLFPQALFAGVSYVIASWSLYGDPELFDLWQLWSHLLVHPQWWQLGVEIVLMLVFGRALERTLGPALFIAMLACLGPLGGVALVLIGRQEVVAGALPLMLALGGALLGRLPGALTSWSLVWWLVVAVGQWPLFRLPLHTLLFLLLVLVVAAAPADSAIRALLAALPLAALGLGLGALARRFEPPLAPVG